MTRLSRRVGGARWAAVVVLAPVVACTAQVEQHASPPTSTPFASSFPSTAVAVAADSVQVFVFDRAAPGGDCQSLVQQQKIGGQMPVALVQAAPASPCEILGEGKGIITGLGYGARSLLAVSQRGGKDFFIGCATTTLSQASTPVSITLAPASATIVVPTTTCTSLTQRCSKGC